MRRLAVIALALLALASTALAAEPQKRITPADQARARAMLLRQADVGLGYRSVPNGMGATRSALTCGALDESDLTLTGEAYSPNFSSGLQAITSAAEIYASVRDANTSWRRGTGTAGVTCIANVLRRTARTNGVRFVSFRRVPFPSLAPRTTAYRWQTLVGGVRLYTDIVLLMRGRAQAALFFVSGIDPLEHEEQVRLGRVVTKRMAKAMRGA